MAQLTFLPTLSTVKYDLTSFSTQLTFVSTERPPFVGSAQVLSSVSNRVDSTLASLTSTKALDHATEALDQNTLKLDESKSVTTIQAEFSTKNSVKLEPIISQGNGTSLPKSKFTSLGTGSFLIISYFPLQATTLQSAGS